MPDKDSCLKIILVILAFLLSVSPPAQGDALSSRFSRGAAEDALARVQKAADDYIKLSEMLFQNSNLRSEYGLDSLPLASLPQKAEVRVTLKGSELKKLESFNWEMQEIGLRNAIRSLTGYIEYQELEKKRLELELLRAKRAPKAEVEKLAGEIKKAEKGLAEKYAGEGGWAD